MGYGRPLFALALALRLLDAFRVQPMDSNNPTDSTGETIPQVLSDEEKEGLNVTLDGDWWETMDVTKSAKGSFDQDNIALVVIDMQPLFFDASSPWGKPGGLEDSVMNHLWPKQLAVAKKLAQFTGRTDSTFLTKYIVPRRPSEAHGVMRHYYQKELITQDVLATNGVNYTYLQDIMPQLHGLVADGAHVTTKETAGAFGPSSILPQQLVSYFAGAGDKTKTLFVAGVETDYCVISTILAMIDNYYRIVVITDAIGSSQPAAGQAQIDYTLRRFDHMVDFATTDQVLHLLSNRPSKLD